MAEKKTEDTEIESELYAITHTILNLSERYQKADVNDSFFKKSIKKVTNDLLKIHLKLRENNLILSDLLERIKLTNKYYQALDIINKVSALNFADISSHKSLEYSNRISSSVLELPGITTKITSAFITLLDALKLEEFNNIDILDKFFKELLFNIEKFPGLEELGIKINKIYVYLIENKRRLIKNKNFRTLMEEDLYTLFKEFQNTLNIES
ncbi:MAG: hypothetical protein EU550_03290 [Promethearchaeota archaeon]|nr:MAG: hypothetical protein EU550_03290 [Candidatus Lokiarchaeota archaeon]